MIGLPRKRTSREMSTLSLDDDSSSSIDSFGISSSPAPSAPNENYFACFDLPPPTNSKRVQISDEIEVLFAEGWTSEETEAAWYTNDDIAGMKSDARSTVKAIRKMKGDISALSGTKHCTRGLEHFCTKGFMEYTKNMRYAVVYGVLDEQDQQKMSGKPDSLALASMSLSCSKWAQDLAVRYAQNDAMEAALIYYNSNLEDPTARSPQSSADDASMKLPHVQDSVVPLPCVGTDGL